MTKELQLNTRGLRPGSALAGLLAPDPTPSNEPSATPNSGPSTGDAEVAGRKDAPERTGAKTAEEGGGEGKAKRATVPRAPAQALQRGTEGTFWAVGILEQTSVAVDPELLRPVESMRQELSVPAATLFSAIVQAGLPAEANAAADAVLLEQSDHPGRGREHNLRMPVGLKARLDELLKEVKVLVGRATRSDLINAALRTGMPDNVDQARELYVAYHRQQTLARRTR